MLVWKASRSHSMPWTMFFSHESPDRTAVESSATWRLKYHGTTRRMPTSPSVGQKWISSQQKADSWTVATPFSKGIGPEPSTGRSGSGAVAVSGEKPEVTGSEAGIPAVVGACCAAAGPASARTVAHAAASARRSRVAFIASP